MHHFGNFWWFSYIQLIKIRNYGKFWKSTIKIVAHWAILGHDIRTVRTEEPNPLEPDLKPVVVVKLIKTGTECILKIQNRNRRILEPTKHY